MKPLWSLFLTVLAIFNLQNISCADQVTHKEALDRANKSIQQNFKNIEKSLYYPFYHFAPPINLVQVPSGFVYFSGQYHLFYHQNFLDNNIKQTYIAHSVSPDLLHWQAKPFALAKSEDYDKDELLSGSAIVDDDLLYLIYTGRSDKYVEGYKEHKETQNLAMSKDGINFAKSANNPVIKVPPHYAGMFFSSEKFRAPYVWKHGEKYYALIGSQFEETKDGAVVLYKSDDLRNWIFVNVTAIGSKGEMGEMWDFPQLIKIGDYDLLSISLEGLKPNEKMFLNKHNSGYFLGALDYNSGKFKQKGAFKLFDYGFDFYAPQIVKSHDGKNVMFALMDMPDSASLLPENNLSGMYTIPREVDIVDGNLLFKPLTSLKELRYDSVHYKNQRFSGIKKFPQVLGSVYEMNMQVDLANAEYFAIKLRASDTQETKISYDKESHKLVLNRDKSSIPSYGVVGEREICLPLDNNHLKLQIFVDMSSVEVFANNGQVVMSSRIFPDENSMDIIFESVGDAKLNYLDFYKLKTTH